MGKGVQPHGGVKGGSKDSGREFPKNITVLFMFCGIQEGECGEEWEIKSKMVPTPLVSKKTQSRESERFMAIRSGNAVDCL